MSSQAGHRRWLRARRRVDNDAESRDYRGALFRLLDSSGFHSHHPNVSPLPLGVAVLVHRWICCRIRSLLRGLSPPERHFMYEFVQGGDLHTCPPSLLLTYILTFLFHRTRNRTRSFKLLWAFWHHHLSSWYSWSCIRPPFPMASRSP